MLLFITVTFLLLRIVVFQKKYCRITSLIQCDYRNKNRGSGEQEASPPAGKNTGAI